MWCGYASAFQDTSTVHACSTVTALLCIPVSELVSFAFSTIPICPFLIQRIFHLLVSTLFLFAFQHFACYLHVHDQHQHLYLSVLKNTSKEGLELLRLLINSGALLHKKINACCRMGFSYDIISGIGSLVGKGLTYSLWSCLHYWCLFNPLT